MKLSARLVACSAVLALSGCTVVPAEQWNSLQAQNRALAEQNQVQLAEIENLRAHDRTVEDELLRDEKQLAAAEARLRADQQRGTDQQRGADERIGMKDDAVEAR